MALFVIVIVAGIFSAETRIAMDLIQLSDAAHLQKVYIPNQVWRKTYFTYPLRIARYLVGCASAFLAVVFIGQTLEPLQQAGLAILVGLSGNAFIRRQLTENKLDEDLADNTRSHVGYRLEMLGAAAEKMMAAQGGEDDDNKQRASVDEDRKKSVE